MWHQFTFYCPVKVQEKLIHALQSWILELEAGDMIVGYAFNHYYGATTNDHLSLRFTYEKDNLEKIESDITKKLKELNLDIKYIINDWSGHENVLKGYEIGSRCAFLIWDLIERNILPKKYLPNFKSSNTIDSISLQFQQHFTHGLVNSLNIPKYPNEQILHLVALLENYRVKNIHELYEKLKTDPIVGAIQTQ